MLIQMKDSMAAHETEVAEGQLHQELHEYYGPTMTQRAQRTRDEPNKDTAKEPDNDAVG